MSRVLRVTDPVISMAWGVVPVRFTNVVSCLPGGHYHCHLNLTIVVTRYPHKYARLRRDRSFTQTWAVMCQRREDNS